jgi:hypothetical protein
VLAIAFLPHALGLGFDRGRGVQVAAVDKGGAAKGVAYLGVVGHDAGFKG